MYCNEYMIVAVVTFTLSNCKLTPPKKYRDFNKMKIKKKKLGLICLA